MGADQSKRVKPTLAETRYKIERPNVKRKVRPPKIREDECGIECTMSQSPSCSYMEGSVDSGVDARSDGDPTEVEPNIQALSLKSTSYESALSRPLMVEKQTHFLTRRERILLEHSWKKCKKTGPEHVGSKIFLMVLTAQPDIKPIFGLEKIPQGRLKYDPRFRQHALVFIRTFDYVIKNIEFPDKLEQHFENLGRRHVAFQGRGFHPIYWETFAECMTQAAVEWEAHKQRLTLSAWRTLVTTVITSMRRGFDEENGKRKYGLLPRRLPSSYSYSGPHQPRRINFARF
ncbi:unnamed protein product, partial [Mesorhabditis belari]|uniref:Globin family profile domain-containing protein n=1 Tax=Mesorhabditis belari TaxID=2138241 RepID=A0AAF3EYV0_9BILA